MEHQDNIYQELIEELEMELLELEDERKLKIKSQNKLNHKMNSYKGNGLEGYEELDTEEERLGKRMQRKQCKNCFYRRNDGICGASGESIDYIVNIKCGDCWSYLCKVR